MILIEAIIKIIGLGVRYFKSSSNIFDFIVVTVSLIGIFVETYAEIDGAISFYCSENI